MRPLQEANTHSTNKSGEVLWYSTPHETIETNHGAYKGAIISTKCKKTLGPLDSSGKCSACSAVFKSKDMEMRIRRAQRENAFSSYGTVNNKHLRKPDKDKKLQFYRAKLKAQRLVNRLSEKIREYANRGDVSAIKDNINRTYKQGCFSGSSKTLKFIKDITSRKEVWKLQSDGI